MSTTPCFIFRAPGPIRRARYSYSTLHVATPAQLEEKLASGWHLTLEQAITAAGDNASRHVAKRKVRTRKVKPQVRPEPRRASVRKAAPKPVATPAPVEIPTAIPDDNAAPTREELEAKATELGIKFDGRTKNKKLGQLIRDRLSEPTGE
jgi:hypothetical protein